MVQGIIKTKDLLTHPITLISVFGLIGYLKVLAKCLDNKPHCFLDMMFEMQTRVSTSNNNNNCQKERGRHEDL